MLRRNAADSGDGLPDLRLSQRKMFPSGAGESAFIGQRNPDHPVPPGMNNQIENHGYYTTVLRDVCYHFPYENGIFPESLTGMSLQTIVSCIPVFPCFRVC